MYDYLNAHVGWVFKYIFSPYVLEGCLFGMHFQLLNILVVGLFYEGQMVLQ